MFQRHTSSVSPLLGSHPSVWAWELYILIRWLKCSVKTVALSQGGGGSDFKGGSLNLNRLCNEHEIRKSARTTI